jgi:beta-galactosidase
MFTLAFLNSDFTIFLTSMLSGMQKAIKLYNFRAALIGFMVMSLRLNAQQHNYQINIDVPEKQIRTEHLKLGGKDSAGNEISVNNYYLSYNKKPMIPVTAEFHFSRYPENFWDESIKKIKAGGANIIASYVFWNIHEEKEGSFNWTGNRNLKKFIELCGKNGMQVIVRIGPFGHGEIRSGGLPDWLLAKHVVIRSNDAEYLKYVEKLYSEIGNQLNGLYFKDGGPIIATQIENEFQHSASPWGLTYPGQPADWTAAEKDLAVTHQGVSVSDTKNANASSGTDHMKTLKSIAQKAGIITPLYTATGWGNAAIIPEESLPVTAGYAYPTWTTEKDLSNFYLFTDLTKTPDYSPVSYDPQQYPAFAAELGCGIMSTYSRRPVVPAASTDALINRCLGSGANGVGYYMYHGGSTPKGDFFFNDEAYAYPKISYDFQAPIGEYGQIRPSFNRLKLIHYFTESFGDLLAPMSIVLPADNASIKPNNIDKLRYAVRAKNGAGFVFVNNFQDDTTLTDKKNVQLTLKSKQGDVSFPNLSIASGENAILPFNMNIGGAKLSYATAQLLMKAGPDKNPFYVFFTPEGMKSEFAFAAGKGIEVSDVQSAVVDKNNNGLLIRAKGDISTFTLQVDQAKIKILVLSKQEALKSWITNINGQKHLVISEASVIQGNDNKIDFFSEGKNQFYVTIFPGLAALPTIEAGSIEQLSTMMGISKYLVKLPEVNADLPLKVFGKNKLSIDLSKGLPSGLNDVRIVLNYIGDTGMAFSNGSLFADDFYKGLPWEISSKHFLNDPSNKQMHFYFRPLYKKAPFLVDLAPEVVENFTKNNVALDIKDVKFIPEYKTTMLLGAPLK